MESCGWFTVPLLVVSGRNPTPRPPGNAGIEAKMKMDGYEIIRIVSGIGLGKPTYSVYTWDSKRKIKTYRNGYTSYAEMIAAHPELKDKVLCGTK